MDKKKVFNILSKNVKNAFSQDEAGQKAAEAILELVQSMIESEEEFTLADVEEKIKEAIKAVAPEAPAAVEERINNIVEAKLKAIKNVASKGITKEVKNAAAKVILNARSAEDVKEGLARVAKENGISGLTFADVVDYNLADKFGDENALFAKLHKSEINKFFYVSETMATATALAKQHTKGAEKDIQSLTAEGKTMTPKMIFKRQQVDVEDMLRLKKAGREAELVSWITAELRRVLTNTEVMAILVGDTVNPSGKRITSFETIKKSESDIWTIVKTAAAAMPTVAEVRDAVDGLYNPNGYEVVAVMNKKTQTALAGYLFASGGDRYFRSAEELAGQIGVSIVYNTNLVADGEVVILIPEEYYVHNEGEVEVAYDQWENNKHNFQYERMDCGAIHGLLSTAYVEPTTEEG